MTASNFGAVIKRTTSFEPLVQRLLQARNVSVAATVWGVEHEAEARAAYLRHKKSSSPDFRVSASGLVLMTNGFIGCSPDGIVFDPTATTQRGLLEIKCPHKIRHTSSPADCSTERTFPCTVHDGQLRLKPRHDYFFQCQGGMAITDTEWCDFVVWTPQWLSIERISFQADEWSKKWLPALTCFFKDELLPALLPGKSTARPASTEQQSRLEITKVSSVAGQCCNLSCSFPNLVLRKCVSCAHQFHHLCTTHDLGKLCSCCFQAAPS